MAKKEITKKEAVENRIKKYKTAYNGQPSTDEERFVRLETIATESYGLIMILNYQMKRLKEGELK